MIDGCFRCVVNYYNIASNDCRKLDDIAPDAIDFLLNMFMGSDGIVRVVSIFFSKVEIILDAKIGTSSVAKIRTSSFLYYYIID